MSGDQTDRESLWSRIPDLAKKWTGAIMAVGAMFVLAYGHFQTDAEAADWREQHNTQLVYIRIDNIKEEIKRLEYEARFDKSLTDDQKKWKEDEIKRLEKKIDCVRDRKENC